MTMLFVDLKAAFDSVDKGILIKVMRERGIREELIDRVREIVEKTRSRVGVEGKWETVFGRQGE